MSVSIVSAKGWVVIPKEIRERYGFKKGTRVRFVEYGGVVGIIPAPENAAAALDALAGKFADGPSLTADLLEDHAWELENDERKFEAWVRSG